MNTLKMFCAAEQLETAHSVDVDGNGEVILTCACGRFTKLPGSTDAAGLQAYVAAHNASNVGQVTQESIDEKKAALLASLG